MVDPPVLQRSACGLQAYRKALLVAVAAISTREAAAPSFQVCLHCMHMYILYVCLYICVCVYVCGHVYMYIYACVYIYVYVCIYIHVYVYVYVYAYLCIDCGCQYQYFSVWTVSCMRMCVRVHMYARYTGVFNTNVHICEHTRCRLCTYVYMHIYVYMHACVYGCVCASMILLDPLRCC